MKKLMLSLLLVLPAIAFGAEDRPQIAPDLQAKLDELQTTINYRFRKPSKLIKALTTSNSNPAKNYEIYELLGDTVLHLAVTEILLKKGFENTNPGTLTEARTALEQNATLALLARKLNLRNYVIKSINENIDDVILSDVVEALIAAIYKDSGPTSAQRFIERYWLPMLNGKDCLPKTPFKLIEKWLRSSCKKDKKLTETAISWMEWKPHIKIETIDRYNNLAQIAKYLPDRFKKELIVSPLDQEYTVFTSAINSMPEKAPSWAICETLLNNRAKLTMIAQLLSLPDVKFKTTKEDAQFEVKLIFPNLSEITAQAKSKWLAREIVAKKVFANLFEKFDRNELDAQTKQLVARFRDSTRDPKQMLNELAVALKIALPKYDPTPKPESISSEVTLMAMTVRSGDCRTRAQAEEQAAHLLLKKWLEYVKENYSSLKKPEAYVNALTTYFGLKRFSYVAYRAAGKVSDPVQYYTQVLDANNELIVTGETSTILEAAHELAARGALKYLLDHAKDR